MSDPTLGEVPPHWTVTTLGAVCDEGGGSVQTGPFGSQLHAHDYVDSGIPSIMPLNIGENRIVEDDIKRITNEDAIRLSKYRVRPGDIVYSRRGDVERHALVRTEQDGWLCGTGCLRVRFGDGAVLPKFASFYLDHPYVRKWIVRHAVGATMPNLNTKIMSAVPFVVPPKPEQKAIANILGTLDDKIELNRRMNETLESIARAIFKSWFVDFDPVRAKLEGQSHEQQSSASAYPMPAEVYDLFPSAFQDSELGKIPEGWEVVKIGEVLKLVYGKALKKGDRVTGEYPVYGSNGRVGWHNEKLTDGPGIIIGRKGNPGIVTWSQSDFFAIDTTFYVEPYANPTSLHYLYYALILEDLARFGTDSAVPGLNRNMAYQSYLLKPTVQIIGKFDGVLSSLREKQEVNDSENRTLAQLRDTLLPKLLSGELTVPDALLQAEEVL